MIKQTICCGLLALGFMASSPFEEKPCPTMDVKAQCLAGRWQAHIVAPEHWELSSQDISGSPCNNEGEQSDFLIWNYAAYHGRVGAICNFSLRDRQHHEISSVQLISRSFLSGSTNWRSGGYPTYKICDVAQEQCKFLKIPE